MKDLFALTKLFVQDYNEIHYRDHKRIVEKKKCGHCGQILRGARDYTRHREVVHGIKPKLATII